MLSSVQYELNLLFVQHMFRSILSYRANTLSYSGPVIDELIMASFVIVSQHRDDSSHKQLTRDCRKLRTDGAAGFFSRRAYNSRVAADGLCYTSAVPAGAGACCR